MFAPCMQLVSKYLVGFHLASRLILLLRNSLFLRPTARILRPTGRCPGEVDYPLHLRPCILEKIAIIAKQAGPKRKIFSQYSRFRFSVVHRRRIL